MFFLGREIGLKCLNLSKSQFIAFLTFHENIRVKATFSLIKLSIFIEFHHDPRSILTSSGRPKWSGDGQ